MVVSFARPYVRFALAGLIIAQAAAVGLASAGPAAAPKAPAPVTFDAKLLKGMSFRSIGPANMGGRVSDIEALAANPGTWYVATGTGGAFRTDNMGTTWTPIFEKEAVASVGAIGLFPGREGLVWLGTGEANSRNSSSWGKGVYRSGDAGESWKASGLEATGAIARIVCDPTDSNTVYVAALGRLWGENPERGVYKTSDGGANWQQVLKVDARTGAVDLVMDPSNPHTLYAAMYARRRTPWSYSGSGTTGGIFRSTDAGRTWTHCTAGLPSRTGRIGLCVYAKDPRVVYAVVESDEGGRLGEFEDASRSGGVFRSDDRGEHWSRLSPFAPRAFYFSQIRVEPEDSTRIYVLGTDVFVSDDGGATFRSGGARNLHPDAHAMWIGPHGRPTLLGTDGGVFVSHDRAANWRFVDNLAIGEFYDVATDNDEPYYHVYGGLQDNQSWGGPSRTRFEVDSFFDDAQKGSGILNDHWYVLGGGDGFHVQADPTAPNIVYYESQGGELVRQDLASGKERVCRPSNGEGEPVFRFNWNTPFQISPHDPTVLWMGGQYVFKLTQRGDRWERVSPDLTTRNPERMASGGSGAETYCTIVALAESPVRAGVVWAGTDDGKVWVSPDDGHSWNDCTANLKGVPAGLYVSSIEPSHHDANTAYLSIDGHRSDDRSPHLLVTHDLGRSWTSLAGPLPAEGPVQVVREGLHNPRLLFAGTEFGLFLSLDAGHTWWPMKEGLPTVAVDDVHIQPRELDLVIATHGRSLYVLDGIQALEEFSASTLQDSVTFFAPKRAWAWYKRSLGGKWGQAMFTAKNPEFGAWFDYFVPREVTGGVHLAIADSSGRLVRSLTGEATAGWHRVVWDLAAGDPKTRIARLEWGGQTQFVRPGSYKVTLTLGAAAPRVQRVEVQAVPGTYSSDP